MVLADRSFAEDFANCVDTNPPKFDIQIITCTQLLTRKNLSVGDRVRMLSARGKAYFQTAEYDKAIIDFSHAIGLDRGYRYAYEYRGLSYFEKKLFNQAILDFNIALSLDPKLSGDPTGVLIYLGRGGAYFGTDQLDLARADLEKVLKLGNETAIHDLARLGIEEIDRVTANRSLLDSFDKAIRIGRTHWLLTLVFLIGLLLVIRRWRAIVLSRRYNKLIDMADDWFREHEIDPRSLIFNVYNKAVLVKNRDAVAFVGSGQAPGEPKGFILEVDPKLGVVDGLIVPHMAAMRSKERARLARLHGTTLINLYIYEFRREIPKDSPADEKKVETQPPGSIPNPTDIDKGVLPKLHGNMPDIMSAKPVSVFRCDRFLLYLLENPKTIKETITGEVVTALKYPLSLGVLDPAIKKVAIFVSIEESVFGTRMLGVFNEEGVHQNRGPIGQVTKDEFLKMAVQIFREITGSAGSLQKLS